jgi:hypothetical protein
MKAPIPTKTSKSAPKGAKVATIRPKVDWDAVKRDYRTNKFTDTELASRHNITRESISRKRKAEGPQEWPKDLAEAIKQATDAALVQSLVTQGHTHVTETVAIAAEVNKNVILGHRTGLNRIASIKSKLLEQIEQAAENMQDLAEVIEMARNPDENGIDRANDALRKVMGRSALVDDLKKLADVDEKVRKGEREAFGLNDGPEEDAKSASSMTDAERAVRLVAILQRSKGNP